MKQPTKKRYGVRRTAARKRSPKTQILNRKRILLDVVVPENEPMRERELSISPLDRDDASPLLAPDEDRNSEKDRFVSERNNDNDRNSEDDDDEEESDASTSKARSGNNQRHSHFTNATTLFRESLFLEQPSAASSSKSTKKSSSTSKKSNDTTKLFYKASSNAGIKKSNGSASTAKMKNTLRLATRKKTPSRKSVPKKKSDVIIVGRGGGGGGECDNNKIGLLGEALSLREPVPLPGNITVRTTNEKRGGGGGRKRVGSNDTADGEKEDRVVGWEEDEISVLTGATKKKKRVLRDLGNRVKESEAADAKVKMPIQIDLRTKSARKKRKSVQQDSISTNKKPCIKKNPCVIFSVPDFEAGRYGEDKYQERKYMGLIEGVGGGIEEEDKDTNAIPHRGRLMELPGELVSGVWKAQVLSEVFEGSSYHRISLRHESAEYSSLEAHLQMEDQDQLSVSILNPLKNRIKSFIDQAVLCDDEIFDELEGKEQVMGGAFLGCISLVWFDGFTSSSDAVNSSSDVSAGLLKLCVPPSGMSSPQELCKIVESKGSNATEETIRGVVFRTELEFDDDYSVLVSHTGFEIDAVDVVFRKINVHSKLNANALSSTLRRGLTPSLISHHLDDVGSSVDDVMLRFKDGHAEPGSDVSMKHSLRFLSENAPVEIDAVRSGNQEHNDPASEKDEFKVAGMKASVKALTDNMARNEEFDGLEQKENVEPNDLDSNYDEYEDLGLEAGDVFDADESQEKLQSVVTTEKPSNRELEENDLLHEPVNNKKSCEPIQVGRGADDISGVDESNESMQSDVCAAKKPSTKELQEIDPITVPNKKTCELVQHLSSPALEAVKKRSYTTILSHNDITAEIGQVALTTHNKKHTSASNSTEPSALLDLSSRALEAVKRVSQHDRANKNISEGAQVSQCTIAKVTYSEPTAEPTKENMVDLKAVAPIFVGGNTSEKTEEPSKHVKSANIKLESTADKRQCGIGPTRSSKSVSNAKGASRKANRRLSYNTEPKISSRRSSSAQSNIKKVPTPATAPNVTRNNLCVPQTIQKSISRDLFRDRSKHAKKKKLNYSSLVESSTKMNKYASDLFGDNESNFGIPTIKTPATRRKSTGGARRRSSLGRSKPKAIRRSSASRSKPKLASTTLSPDKIDTRHMASLPLPSKSYTSPVVTPGGKKDTRNDEKDVFHNAVFSPITALSVKDAVSQDDSNAFYDATSISFEDQMIPLIRSEERHDYSSPHRFHNVYYGLYSQSQPITSTSPSNNAWLLKSPERCGAFHDYYYGQNENTTEEEYYSTAFYDQPIHDVYFGQHMHCDQLPLTELIGSPDSSQALHDTYFGQQEILPKDDSTRGNRRRVVSHGRPLPKVQFRLFHVLLIIWSIFQAANQPENTRSQSSEPLNLITNSTHAVEKDIEQHSVGWFSSWS